MNEIFKDIPNYEGIYQVSNLGRVKSLERNVKHFKGGLKVVKEKILKAPMNTRYRVVCLSLNNKKKFQVHQLVAMAFLNHKPCGMKLIVDHINNNPSDNRLDNLQLISQRENCSKDRKGGASKYTGVNWHKACNKWMSAIIINGKYNYLGLFTDELDAANAYKERLNEILT